ncbi:hypothetical protein Pmani_002058 [Petrolisthes manimaculis]|nr:hypothetical protein Pmani_002058 [Petrolisthes manimaculis]
MSGMRVLVLGEKPWVRDVLLHHSLRNTIHAIYFVLHPRLMEFPKPSQGFATVSLTERHGLRVLWVYRRCMYCDNGEAAVQSIPREVLASLNYSYQHNDVHIFSSDKG